MTAPNWAARLIGRRPGVLDVCRHYGVLCPFVERPDGLHLLYEVRSASLRRQPGEVCFPGGRMEPGETAADCALREIWEELAIPAGDIQVLGESDFIAHPSGFTLRPVPALVSLTGLAAMRPSPAEVGEAFTVPLAWLRTHPPAIYHYDLLPQAPADFPYGAVGIPADYRWAGATVEMPLWLYRGHALWGMTARITRDLLSLTEQ